MDANHGLSSCFPLNGLEGKDTIFWVCVTVSFPLLGLLSLIRDNEVSYVKAGFTLKRIRSFKK
jgi:hypothetical protein